MFVLNDADTAKVKVSFKYPVKGTTRKVTVDFVAEFEIKSSEEHKARVEQSNHHNLEVAQATRKAIENNEDLEFPDTDYDEQFCREDLVGLEGVKDKDKEDIEFSEDLVDMVFKDRYSRAALIKAWLDFCESPDAVKRKN